MGICMIVWLVALRVLSKRNKKLAFVGALGPISACVIGARRARPRAASPGGGGKNGAAAPPLAGRGAPAPRRDPAPAGAQRPTFLRPRPPPSLPPPGILVVVLGNVSSKTIKIVSSIPAGARGLPRAQAGARCAARPAVGASCSAARGWLSPAPTASALPPALTRCPPAPAPPPKRPAPQACPP